MVVQKLSELRRQNDTVRQCRDYNSRKLLPPCRWKTKEGTGAANRRARELGHPTELQGMQLGKECCPRQGRGEGENLDAHFLSPPISQQYLLLAEATWKAVGKRARDREPSNRREVQAMESRVARQITSSPIR